MLCPLRGEAACTALEHRGPFASKPTGSWATVVLREPAAPTVDSAVGNRQTVLLRQWMQLLGEDGRSLPRWSQMCQGHGALERVWRWFQGARGRLRLCCSLTVLRRSNISPGLAQARSVFQQTQALSQLHSLFQGNPSAPTFVQSPRSLL